jgi:ornithine--oxo-acid transaminase
MRVDDAAANRYDRFVNPQWSRLLDILQMNVSYARCSGAELQTTDGRTILDFISGYCVHNIGHNHPRLIEALKDELDRAGPVMLQSHISDLAGELAEKLCQRAGGRLSKAFFASSGSEGIETVVKFARAHTKRHGILSAAGAFHGLTCGALSLMSNPFWREGFGPLLPLTASVPFDDLDALESKLSTKAFAAFVTEPIQAEAGVSVPKREYLTGAQALCRRYGTLFVLDEVQTGLFRTGPFIAAHHFGAEPDMVVLAKALSGGLVPCSAVLMSDAINRSVYSSLQRAVIHTSTFSENNLAMRAALVTLDILEQERLGQRAAQAGEALRHTLELRLAPYEMVREIRGLGLLNAIEFQPPQSWHLRIPFLAARQIHPAMLGQVLVMRLFREHGILSQICGNNFMALKIAPPLIVTDAQLCRYAEAIERVVDLLHSSKTFWSEALGLGRRALASA